MNKPLMITVRYCRLRSRCQMSSPTYVADSRGKSATPKQRYPVYVIAHKKKKKKTNPSPIPRGTFHQRPDPSEENFKEGIHTQPRLEKKSAGETPPPPS